MRFPVTEILLSDAEVGLQTHGESHYLTLSVGLRSPSGNYRCSTSPPLHIRGCDWEALQEWLQGVTPQGEAVQP